MPAFLRFSLSQSSRRRLGSGAVLEHDRNAILHRIIAATTMAMQPSVHSAVRTGRDRMMAHRANKDLEQGLGKHGADHG
jgi:hypothetical protein